MVFEDCIRYSPVHDLTLTLKVIDLESNAGLWFPPTLWFLYLEEAKDLDWATSSDLDLQLRIAANTVKVATTSCCTFGLAPLWIVLDFSVFLTEESAKEQLVEVFEEISNRHPEDAIICSYFFFLEAPLLHTIVDHTLSTLCPLLWAVTPGSLPLCLISPRVSQLHEFGALNLHDI